MKKFFGIVLAMVFCAGLLAEEERELTVNRELLVQRQGITYQANSTTPFTGYATDFFANGKLRFKFQYKNGKEHGSHIEYASNTQIIRSSNYQDGSDYSGVFFDENGNKFMEYKVHGGENGYGEATYFYPNGKIRGTFRYIPFLRLWKQGEEVEYWGNGQVQSRTNYIKGVKNGKYISYYENGQIQYSQNFLNDNLVGESISYYPNGKIKERKVF